MESIQKTCAVSTTLMLKAASELLNLLPKHNIANSLSLARNVNQALNQYQYVIKPTLPP